MGFFKNLIKGDFKKIGQNFSKNLSEGKVIKGSGFDGIINKAADTFSGGALSDIAKTTEQAKFDAAVLSQLQSKAVVSNVNTKSVAKTSKVIEEFTATDTKFNAFIKANKIAVIGFVVAVVATVVYCYSKKSKKSKNFI